MINPHPTLEVVNDISRITSIGGGVTTAGMAAAEKSQSAFVEWVDTNAIVLGLAISGVGVLVQVACSLFKLYLDYKDRKRKSER